MRPHAFRVRQPEVIEASEVGSHFESDFLDSLETRCTPEIRELPGPWTDVKPWKLTWAPDSRQILFIRPVGRPGEVMRSELWGVPVQGGEQRSLGFSVPQDVGSLSIHPDGKQLAFHVGEGVAEVWVMENFLPSAGAAQ